MVQYGPMTLNSMQDRVAVVVGGSGAIGSADLPPLRQCGRHLRRDLQQRRKGGAGSGRGVAGRRPLERARAGG